ncbi:MAG: triose-phosphate isomerase [Patescibacteria group bacterium]
MQKTIIANWKMQLSYRASLDLARAYVRQIKNVKHEPVLCPDYLALPDIARLLKNSRIKLGAQDSAAAPAGAYTGEVSPANLKALGASYVILGHSERREHLHENSALINAKLRAALNAGLTPVLCIGEKLIEKENGETKKYLAAELKHALKGVKLTGRSRLLIAYEPVWAISSNQNAKPLAAQEAAAIHRFIKQRARVLLKKTAPVLYGGSVNAGNAAEFLRQPAIDGLLIGGASLKLRDFFAICL